MQHGNRNKKMYYPYFITYMVAGFVISLIVFLWAMRHGQFRDQERARFLPLLGEPEAEPPKKSVLHRVEMVALLLLAGSMLFAIVAVLGFALVR